MVKQVLPALLWLPSILLAAWLWSPHPVACLGAALGCCSAVALQQNFERRMSWMLFFASLLLGFAALQLLSNVPLAPPSSQILTRAGVFSWLAAHIALFIIHRAHRKALIPLECALFAAPWILWLWPHRDGHLDRPVALMETLQAAGVDPTRFLTSLGIFLGLGLLVLLGARESPGPGMGSIVSLLLLGLVLSLTIPSQKAVRLAATNSQSSSQTEQERKLATTPVAVIVFYSDYRPDLGVYHFRPQPVDRPDASRPKGRRLRYRVAEIVAQDRRLVQGWEGQHSPVVVPDKETFAAVYEMVSTVPEQETIELMQQAPFRPSAVLEKTAYSDLLEQILPEQDREHPLRAAMRIKLWLERHRAQGPESTQGAVEDSLLQNRPVNQKNFTQAAQELLRAAGISSELVSGYAIRADQKGTGSFLLITEEDRRWWLELSEPGYAGLEIDLFPLDAPEQSQGPENLDMQRQLGELARAREPRFKPLAGLGSGTLGLAIFALVMLCGGYLIKLYRQARAYFAPPKLLTRVSYQRVLDRLAEVKELRASGETRYEFSQRLKSRVPSLQPLTQNFQRATLGPPGSGDPGQASALARACLEEIARGYPRRRRWLGALNPFSWLKVH